MGLIKELGFFEFLQIVLLLFLVEAVSLSHHLAKISDGVSKIAYAIFFVNVFAYGRAFFATIFATRISHEAVISLAASHGVLSTG
ncbi:hypothetical protein AVI52_15445 [Piscirickettsia salmonis]|nr:hypothetical protein AVI52_15445 [Piscirickettsia salmonis]